MTDDLTGRENCYVCETCRGVLNTVHRVHGTTPFMLGCRATAGCRGWMRSQWYPPTRPTGVPAPSHEWYKPGKSGYRKLSPEMRDHVDRGGLLLRPIAVLEPQEAARG